MSGLTAFVDLGTKSVRVEPTAPDLIRAFLGGRGLNMAYLSRLDPSVDAFSPSNLLIFGTGLLTGYPVPNSSRMNISARSPETGGLGDANMGGFFPAAMKRAGFDRLVIRGRAYRPVLLWLAEGHAQIRPATSYWGLDVPASQEALRADLGEEVRSAVIGPAGEHLVRFAAVLNGRKNAAGRGGMGAVMGAKNLKAVVAQPGEPLPGADRTALLKLRRELNDYLHSSKIIELLGKVGTPLLYENANRLGATRTKNSQLNQWVPELGASYLAPYVERMVACSGCTVHCRHVNRLGGEGPDYSSLALLGANCGLTDLEAVIGLANLCNDLGLDTSSAGTVIPWAIELFERGLITSDLTGRDLTWGDPALVRDLLLDIAARRGFGDVLADSSQAIRLGKLPPAAADYLIATKGLPQSDPHDVRYLKGFALGIATSSRGADHLRSRPTLDILNLPEEVREAIYAEPTANDPTSYDTREVSVTFTEEILAVADALGICKFVCRGWNSPKLLGYEHFAELVRLAIGLKVTAGELREVGRRIVDLERMITSGFGLTSADDTLPRRYFDEPMPLGATAGSRIDRGEFASLLGRYYQRRGWSSEGEVREVRRAELRRLTRTAVFGSGE